MLVKPAQGLKIRDPATRLIVPSEGMEVDHNDPFWARALRDKDVHEVKVREVKGEEISDPRAGTGEAIQIPTKDAITGEDIPPIKPADELGAPAEPAKRARKEPGQ